MVVGGRAGCVPVMVSPGSGRGGDGGGHDEVGAFPRPVQADRGDEGVGEGLVHCASHGHAGGVEGDPGRGEDDVGAAPAGEGFAVPVGLLEQQPLAATRAIVLTKVVVVNGAGLVLIVWRSSLCAKPGRSDLPGGGLDFGEEPVEGARREVREEVGLEMEDVRLVEVVSYLHREHYALMFGYTGHVVEDEVKLSWEHDRYAWMSFEKALELEDLPEGHMKVLKAAQNLIEI